jgi:primosomal protein N' (replication factor Y)
MSEAADTSVGRPAPADVVLVALHLPVRHGWSYRVPERLMDQVLPGMRVAVPFRGRPMPGFVLGPGTAPEGKKLAEVIAVLDPQPLFDPPLLKFLGEAADYYLHPIGEVLRAAAPPLDAEALTALRKGGVALKGPRAKAQRARIYTLVEGAVIPPRLGPQQKALLARLTASPEIVHDELPAEERAAAASLVRRGVLSESARERSPDRFFRAPIERDAPRTPTVEQEAAIAAIDGAIRDGARQSFLLHGVTGSGKTEVYLQTIETALARGRGALVLVPEIALTPQLVGRFRARFGDALAVLHSGLSDVERAAFWRALRRGAVQIAIGARSAVFAPVPSLGLVVVDEEHDGSYKQEEGFRYHARDLALLRAHRSGAVVVLGSATPSLESWELGQRGQHRVLTMTSRPKERPLPAVQIIDLARMGPGPSGEKLLSLPLHRALEETLEQGGQAILFLNRRGFAPSLRCEACGENEACPNCSVALVAHRRARAMRCHYCDFAAPEGTACSRCGEPALVAIGTGTERLEDTLEAQFPSARIARLDRDVAAHGGLESVLERARQGEIDILVGTQMVTKGHDLPGVTLVGVILADQSLFFPDFRAAERTFQLLSQVAGRAGRGDKPGRVIVQTYQPQHPAVLAAQRHDHLGFVTHELAERAELGYPPHGRLAAVRIDAEDRAEAEHAANLLAEVARATPEVESARVEVLGPAPAPIERVRSRYRQRLLLRGVERRHVRAVARAVLERIEAGLGKARASVDVDPVSML